MEKADTNTLLRTPATWQRYRSRRETLKPDECFLCRLDHMQVVKEFKHWVIVQNQYPYDAVAEVHHLLAPRVHVPETDDLDDVKELLAKRLLTKE